MISTVRLLEHVSDSQVAFDRHGEAVDVDMTADRGQAVLVVSPATDAVKAVRKGIVESLDREELWVVEAMVLSESIVRQLDATFDTADDLLKAVRDLGHSWEVRPVSSP